MDWVTDAILARRPWLAAAGASGLFSFGFTQAEAPAHPAAQAEVAERLMEAYRRARADDPGPAHPPDMWTEISARFHQDLARLASQGPAAELMAYLRCLPRLAGGHGFLQGEAGFDQLANHPEHQRTRALWLMDQLVGMAEGVGVLASRCPEQVGYADMPTGAGAGELRDRIEARTGVPVSLPPVFEGLFALEPGTRPVHLRTLSAGYAVWKAASFARQLLGAGTASMTMAEIGAGMGYTAYAAHRLGVAGYTIYDLPEVNVVQGYFLLMTLPPSAVGLYGEEAPVPTSPWARVLPAYAAYEAPAGAFDVTLNVDSLPEIAREEALRYLSHFSSASRLLFSVNQEAQAPQAAGRRQSVVRELAEASAGLRPLLRYPNWARAGYVDELWACGTARLAGPSGPPGPPASPHGLPGGPAA